MSKKSVKVTFSDNVTRFDSSISRFDSAAGVPQGISRGHLQAEAGVVLASSSVATAMYPDVGYRESYANAPLRPNWEASNRQVPVLGAKKRGMLKSGTFNVLSSTQESKSLYRRSEAAQLSPEALVELHKLHEQFMGKDPWYQEIEENTADEVLDATWGSQGTWQFYGATPADSERSMNLRRLKCCPKLGWSGERLASTNNIAAICTKGRKDEADETIGQDNCSFTHLQDGWNVICVMDGHGVDGHWPSTRSVRTMPFFLQGKSCMRMRKQSQTEGSLKHAFQRVEEDLTYRAFNEEIDLQACGCTATVVMWSIEKKELWVATCGDSRAILVVPRLGLVKETQDHKPILQSERARIEACGGEITTETYGDGTVDTRVDVKDAGYPGLSMTRALGDLCVKEYGVIAEPEVVQWPWHNDEDAFVLAASDGLWEFLSTQEVVTIFLESLKSGRSQGDAVQELLKRARRAWGRWEDVYCDDITIMVSRINGTKTLPEEAKRALSCSSCIDTSACSVS